VDSAFGCGIGANDEVEIATIERKLLVRKGLA
jgi:hypothetical protein